MTRFAMVALLSLVCSGCMTAPSLIDDLSMAPQARKERPKAGPRRAAPKVIKAAFVAPDMEARKAMVAAFCKPADGGAYILSEEPTLGVPPIMTERQLRDYISALWHQSDERAAALRRALSRIEECEAAGRRLVGSSSGGDVRP